MSTTTAVATAADKTNNLQEVFLNKVRKQHTVVTIFLINGVKLQGIITWFDNFTLLLKRDHHIQMVYKHAVSTVMPMQPVTLYDEENPPPEAGDGAGT